MGGDLLTGQLRGEFYRGTIDQLPLLFNQLHEGAGCGLLSFQKLLMQLGRLLRNCLQGFDILLGQPQRC